MGRFSKLETHVPPSSAPPEAGKSALPEGFGTRRSSKAALHPGPDYDARYYQTEGDRYFYHGDYEKSLRMYSRAIQMDHSSVDPWVGQVRCLVELKQAKEAMVWVKRALELFPEEARLISVQGMTYAQTGMVERGLACSDYALGRPGQSAADPLVWVLRGAILSLGDNRNCEICFSKAMETRQRDDWRTPLSLGLVLLNQKKYAKAVEFLEAAVQVEQRNDFLWERLGYARERLGLGQGAMEAYEAAIHQYDANKTARDGLSRLRQSSIWTRFARRLFK